jgi:orotidine-5'-phosphate decarboxylase
MGHFIETLRAAWARNDTLVCVGIDPEPERFPAAFVHRSDAIFEFCRAIVDATADLVCCYKPQIAHFAAHRAETALERLIAHVHDTHPGVPVLLDAKRGDVGSTATNYAIEAFDRYGADAVTVNPYLGHDAVQPFLDRADRGVFLLCRTSNPGARDLQDVTVRTADHGERRLYEHVAHTVAHEWNAHRNCGLVVGATYPRELAEVRAIVGDLPLLLPGVGTQGADVAEAVRRGKTLDGAGLIVSSSRAILTASRRGDFAEAARARVAALREEINAHRR